ncbi:hypothetical protein RESH_01939 [Rhodopirellula europaea SH398]|uniref:Uncharacterized protein n=1 Tax=Rhodopirellula europaea SH398 TaxID=1263868 RepID=M5SIJ0_9BACT|nr:hypothetical protein RESH_01939 [Rhodopirellula europaea SH398]
MDAFWLPPPRRCSLNERNSANAVQAIFVLATFQPNHIETG